jgi:hypothetical protein
MASSGPRQRPPQFRRPAASKKSSGFVFVEVNAHETAKDKSERLSKVRSHLTTQFYKDQRAQKNRALTSRARNLHPKDADDTKNSQSESASDSKSSDSEDDMITALQPFAFAAFDPVGQPGVFRLDPFDALPVKGDVRIDRTLQLCEFAS